MRFSLFYGWVIVSISIVSMTVIYGTRHVFPVFFPSILDEYGWGRSTTALILSLNVLVYGLVAPIVGSLAEWWNPRKVMLIGVTTVGLATGACAFAKELWHFFMLFGILVAIGTSFCGWPLLAPTLVNWFERRRGLVIGLGQVGGGLSFVYSLFVEFVISRWGWRSGYLILAGVLMVIVLPLYLLFLRYRPENIDTKPHGIARLSARRDLRSERTVIEDPVSFDWSLSRAVKTYQLWFLVISYFFYWGIGCYLVLAHQIKFTEDVGYSSTFSATILALFGISTVAGQCSAFISDWIGREKTVSLAAMLAIGALIALISVRDTTQPWLLYVYATCFGYGAGLYPPTMAAGAADMYQGKHFGWIVGLLMTGLGVGGAIGPWIGGYIFEVTGSYRSAFILCIVCFVLASLSLWIAAPRNADRLRAAV